MKSTATRKKRQSHSKKPTGPTKGPATLRIKMTKSLIRMLSAVLLTLIFSLFAFGQEPASVQGTVMDADGRTIPNATVKVSQLVPTTQQRIPMSRTATTDKDGRFTVRPLRAGAYTVTVEAEGFEKTVTYVRLTAGYIYPVDLKLTRAAPETGEETESFKPNEIVGLFSLIREDSDPERFNTYGFNFTYTYLITPRVGISGDLNAHFREQNGTDLSKTSVLGGFTFIPLETAETTDKVTFSTHALFGVAHFKADTGTFSFTDNAFTMKLGGALDINVNNNFFVRLAEVSYAPTFFDDSTHNVQFGFGAGFRFGRDGRINRDFDDDVEVCGSGCKKYTVKDGMVFCTAQPDCKNRGANCECNLFEAPKGDKDKKWKWVAGPFPSKWQYDSDMDYLCSCSKKK